MQTEQNKSAVSKFPLRLMPSVRKRAEEFSRQEGVSLNQFINVAVAERLAHLQHEAWVSSRPKPTAAGLAAALAALDRPTGIAPEPDDELPDGYESIRHTVAYKKALSGKRGKVKAV